MAATLSAEEEQVGLESLRVYASSYFSTLCSPKRLSLGSTWWYFGPVHGVCAPQRASERAATAAAAVRNGGFVAKRSERRAEILYRFLAHYCCRCITVSSPQSAELMCCDTGRARLCQPPQKWNSCLRVTDRDITGKPCGGRAGNAPHMGHWKMCSAET